MLSNKKGFSLVELIIVIVILGILVGIAVPSFMSYVKKANVGVDKANAELIYRNVQIAYAEAQANNEAVKSLSNDQWENKAAAMLPGGKLPAVKSTTGPFSIVAAPSGDEVLFKVMCGGDIAAPASEANGAFGSGTGGGGTATPTAGA